MKKFLFIALLCAGFSSQAQIYWNFNTANNSAGTPTGISVSAVSIGNTGTSNDGMLQSSSVSSGYSTASGGNNAGMAAKSGTVSTSLSSYFEVTLTASANASIKISGLSFGMRSTSTGPISYHVFSSVDNYTTALATGSLSNNSTWTFFSPAFASILQPGTGNPVTLRIYGADGGSASTGNWRIDDLTIIHASTLPVSLLSFTGKALGGYRQFSWTTSEEKNSSHFNILKSLDGKSFSVISKVSSKGNALNNYSFTDFSSDASTAYYQLAQLDLNGETSYSKIIAVNADPSLLQIGSTTETGIELSVSSPGSSKGQIIITDLSGRKLIDLWLEVSKGINKFEIPVEQRGLLVATYKSHTSSTSIKFIR